MLSRLPALLLLLPMASFSFALESVEFSPDIPAAFGTELIGPEETARDAMTGGVDFEGVGIPLPLETDLTALHRTGSHETLFALENTAVLEGGVVARPRDVVGVKDGVAAIVLDGDAYGLGPGVGIDAISRAPDGDLLVSFDVAVDLAGEHYGDDDVVRLGEAGTSLFFSLGDAGFDPALDVDALHLLSNGDLLVSFDGAGSMGELDFADEDLIRLAKGGWAPVMAYDGSDFNPGFGCRQPRRGERRRNGFRRRRSPRSLGQLRRRAEPRPGRRQRLRRRRLLARWRAALRRCLRRRPEPGRRGGAE